MRKKSKKQNQEMTIEDLALITKRAFDSVDKRLKKFATKDDLKKFATKDDLKKFATKDDLRNFATKDDLKNLKEELKEETIEARDAILKSNDKIAKFLKDVREEQAMLIGANRRHEEKLEDHEERIGVLELKVSPA